MPAPLFDPMHITQTMRHDAQPALQRLADTPGLRDADMERFNRDELPAYPSSTEKDEQDRLERLGGLVSEAAPWLQQIPTR